MERDARPLEGGAKFLFPFAGLASVAKGIDRFMRKVEDAAMVLAALSIAVMAFAICLEVVLRVVFGRSTLVSSEYSGYLLVACTLLGMAWTLRDGGFIRVDLVYAKFRGRLLHFANLVIAIIGAMTTLIFTYYVVIFTWQSFEAGVTSIDITRTPLWIPQLTMPIGGALLSWAMFVNLVRAAVLIIYPQLADADEEHPVAELEGWL